MVGRQKGEGESVARFRGTVEGTRGGASRLGNAASGLRVTAHGWTTGVHVDMGVDKDGHDMVRVYRSNGSADRDPMLTLVAEWHEHEDSITLLGGEAS